MFKEECKFERFESRSEEMQRRSRVLSDQQVEIAERETRCNYMIIEFSVEILM